MPELPEVETLCRQLRQRIINVEIEGTSVLDSKLGTLDNLKAQRIVSVSRRGKRIVLELDNGKGLEIHLRMTGRLLWQERGEKPPPHSRFILDMSSGQVIVVDPRRFATLSVVFLDVARESAVVDALNPGCVEVLIEKSRNRMRSVKSFLMDQQIISGIGNIYACEILYRVGFSPRRKAADLSPADWRCVESAMVAVLSKAIECRGTSISDWRDLYGREGEVCQRCGGIIQRERFLGRGTWFCPDCQV